MPAKHLPVLSGMLSFGSTQSSLLVLQGKRHKDCDQRRAPICKYIDKRDLEWWKDLLVAAGHTPLPSPECAAHSPAAGESGGLAPIGEGDVNPASNVCSSDFWCCLVQKAAFGTSSQFCHCLGRLICFSWGLLRAVFCLAQKCKRKGKTIHISSHMKKQHPGIYRWFWVLDRVALRCSMKEGLICWKHILCCGLQSQKIHLPVQNEW